MKPIWLVMEAEAAGGVAEIFFNDIPVERLVPTPDSPVRKVAVPVNHYAVNGVNTLEMVINPGEFPSTTRKARDEIQADRQTVARAAIFLYRVPEDTSIEQCVEFGHYSGDGSGVEILSVTYPAPEEETGPETFPPVVSVSDEFGDMFHRWAWQDGQSMALDGALQGEVESWLEVSARVLEEKRFAEYLESARIGIEETEKAFFRPAGEGASTLSGFLAYEGGRDYWKMVLPEKDRWDLRLCANGKMVDCVARDGEPILRSAPGPDGEPVSFPVKLARIDGQMTIVRC